MKRFRIYTVSMGSLKRLKTFRAKCPVWNYVKKYETQAEYQSQCERYAEELPPSVYNQLAIMDSETGTIVYTLTSEVSEYKRSHPYR